MCTGAVVAERFAVPAVREVQRGKVAGIVSAVVGQVALEFGHDATVDIAAVELDVHATIIIGSKWLADERVRGDHGEVFWELKRLRGLALSDVLVVHGASA